ncbi:hypothetical protein B0H17DRAFT_1082091 [Mycena rosella]|uniref:Uncharacterized protein n=1 Tax=Mycena rosella TaxID=1033263 RepID=A0AAD7D1P5_MYCRO|nr:hypothetical protein B0H17DRAFT_1082091 [Mycena rosella]
MVKYSVQSGFPPALTKGLLASQEREMKSVRRKFDFFNRRDAAKRDKAPTPEPEPDSPITAEQIIGYYGRVTAEPADSDSEYSDTSLWREPQREAATPDPVPSAAGYTIPFSVYRGKGNVSKKALPPTPAEVPDSPLATDDVFTLAALSAVHSTRPPDMSWMSKMFPTIPHQDMILNIVRNDFEAVDLARLDPKRTWDKFEGGCSWRNYPTLQSLLMPLSIYFRVLQAWVAASRDAEATRIVGESALRYTMHIVDLHEQYHWPAVVHYHLQFHEKRRLDMNHGDYSKWAVGDRDLINRLPMRATPANSERSISPGQ